MEHSIFSVIPRETLQEILETLHRYIGICIKLIDREGKTVMMFGHAYRYCDLVSENLYRNDSCFISRKRAMENAFRLGESYIYNCHANLSHISFPLILDRELLAGVLVGPFLMDQPDSTLIQEIMEKKVLTPMLALDLLDELSGIPMLPPDKVTELSKLIGFLLAPLIPTERESLKEHREKFSQQAKINMTVQMYKEQRLEANQSLFYEKEHTLLNKVKLGNVSESKALLNELLGYALFCEGGKLDAVRLRSIELISLLSRVAVEGGANADQIYTLNGYYLPRMNNMQEFDDISMLLQEVVECFMKAMFTEKDKGNPYIRQAMQYISLHYPQSISIGDVANAVGLSENYFSKLFRDTVGEKFQNYLMRIRIEASKQLLLSTDDSLTDIAIAMGFNDQSYYCRCFKNVVGISPGRYRNMK